ncbi:MAG: RNA polymerase factor sigma-54 [Burkholderiaceae bacterium]|nr:RNA polymerase factor sigma-54 [Burkholderiaceae bacterium]
MHFGLELKTSQRLTLTPQLQQAIRLLQLPTLDLVQEITAQIEQNPLLELVDSSGECLEDLPTIEENGNLIWEHTRESDKDPLDWQEAPVTLMTYLNEQLGCLQIEENQKKLIQWLIGSLSENGILDSSLEDIKQDSPFEEVPTSAWEKALLILQSLDPVGVGARNLQEQLLLQLTFNQENKTDSKALDLAKYILTTEFEALSRKNYNLLRKTLNCSENELKNALDIIESLDPHPLSNWQNDKNVAVIPEINVVKRNNHWMAILIENVFPEIRVNKLYAQVINQSSTEESHHIWLTKLSDARQFIRNLDQRQRTLLSVAQLIVQKQQGFFEHGDSAMKPLLLRDIADVLGMHESTISRATNGKYLKCHFGIFELKHFFSAGISSNHQGESISPHMIKEHLRKIIEQENPHKPLSDEKISYLLSQQGITIARRTVSKYREQLGIGPANLRKTL